MWREITIREYIAAIRKNGYRKANGKMFTYKATKNNEPPTEIYAACAMGQAQINLGIFNPRTLGQLSYDSTPAGEFLTQRVVTLNDRFKLKLPQIADILEKEFQESLYDVATRVYDD